MEKSNQAVKSFEKKVASPTMQSEIKRVEEEFSLSGCERSVQFSTFDRGKLKLVFDSSDKEFERIVKEKKPVEIYYEEVNMDDAGNWGNVCIKPSEEIEIRSSQYIFGYLGIWNLCEELGYKDEVRTLGFKNHSGKFVLRS